MPTKQIGGPTEPTLDLESVGPGTPLLTATGDVVGRVEAVRHGNTYVVPEPGVLDGAGPRLTTSAGRVPLLLDASAVKTVDDDGIILRGPDGRPSTH